VIFGRILVAVDGTDAALRGVRVAAQLAARYEAELLVLTVVTVPQPLVAASTMNQRSVEGYIEHLAQDSLRAAVAALHEAGVGAEVKVVVGPPAETILAETEASGADLVVMGRRGRDQPKDLILGSVSYRVSRHVRVPIILVP
jgi:nucleotide-binding universal stress UspA family protein